MSGTTGIGGLIGYWYETVNNGSVTDVSECYYLKESYSLGVGNKTEDIEGKVEVVEQANLPSILSIIQKKIEVEGQEINAFKEDNNHINNGYPILYWQ